MSTLALGRAAAPELGTTRDRALVRRLLEQDRILAAYAVCDLEEEREFARTRWSVAVEDGEAVAVAADYRGPAPQPIFVMGRPDAIGLLLREVVRPRIAYVSALRDALPEIARSYRVDPGPPMVRMHVDRGSFRPHAAPVERLSAADAAELNRLYQLGFAAWLPASAIAEGVYFGIRVNGRLVAAAGTHVVAPSAGLAVVGNVLTHVEHRGRGHATAVTSAVTAELLRSCPDVVLNVRADNPPAIAAYRRLGYGEHRRFEEPFVRRTVSPFADLVLPVRRLIGRGRSAPSRAVTAAGEPPPPRPAGRPRPYQQAHPIVPTGPADASEEQR